jgi:hypothetical protein
MLKIESKEDGTKKNRERNKKNLPSLVCKTSSMNGRETRVQVGFFSSMKRFIPLLMGCTVQIDRA